jgi:predicted MFS family arabinose efflux permease
MDDLPEVEDHVNRLLIPSLYVSQLSTRPAGILMGFILMDIAQTFGTTVGIAGQIVTAASLAGMIVSPFLAALSIRYKPKTLLLVGVALIAVSSLGCSFAFNYASMLVFYSLSGLGAAMVTPMIMTIIGEKIPEEKRSGTIGRVNAVTPILSTFAGLTITVIISKGWKAAYLFYVFPITFISLVLAIFGLRKTDESDSRQRSSTSIKGGFKQIIKNRSALACLLGTVLTQTVFRGIMWYVVSFYRQHWGLPTEFVGLIWSSNTFIYVIGSMLCGRVVPRFGRKKLTGVTVLCVGFFTILYANAPNHYVSILSNLTISILLAFWATSSRDLALAQVPEYSGAMMSLNSGSMRLGAALGSAIGGLVLTVGGYGLLGIVLGITGITAFLVIFFFARDPAYMSTAESQSL